LRAAAVGEVVARRRSPAVKGSAADGLGALIAQIKKSSPGSMQLGITKGLTRYNRSKALKSGASSFVVGDGYQ
jgi:hypothetical protein